MNTKSLTQIRIEQAFRSNHQLPYGRVERKHAIAFTEKWFGMNPNREVSAVYKSGQTYPCEIEVWFDNSHGEKEYQIYIGKSWQEILMQMDTSFNIKNIPDNDDIPF